jgi:hypothetical protein
MIKQAEKAKEQLTKVIESFQNGDIGKFIALSYFPFPNIPCSKWSLKNRLIMNMYGTSDARGFQQWQQINRKVKKGSKAFYILGPVTKKTTQIDEVTQEEKDSFILIGFKYIPVFAIESTEGDSLDYEPPHVPELPLFDVAKQFDLEVKAGFFNGSTFGYYSSSKNLIQLNTKDEIVFFHELAHAAHDRVTPNMSKLPKWKREVVAELSAVVLGLMCGLKWDEISGQAYDYIESYAKANQKSAVNACLEVIDDIEKILNLIFAYKQSC